MTDDWRSPSFAPLDRTQCVGHAARLVHAASLHSTFGIRSEGKRSVPRGNALHCLADCTLLRLACLLLGGTHKSQLARLQE